MTFFSVNKLNRFFYAWFSKKTFPLFVSFFLIGFLVLFLSLRVYPIGADSYYYLGHIFGKTVVTAKPVLVPLFFSLIPPGFFVWDIVWGLFLVGSTVLVWKTALLLYPEHGHFAPLISFLIPLFHYFFIAFEPSSIGLFFGFAATYFFIKNGFRFNLHSLFLLGLGSFFWLGLFFFFLAFSLYDKRLLLVSILVLIVFHQAFFANVFPNKEVIENTPVIVGLFSLFILMYRWGSFDSSFSLLDPRRYFSFDVDKRIALFVLVFFGLTAFSGKWVMLLVPFLVFNIIYRAKNFFSLSVLSVTGSVFFVVVVVFASGLLFPNQNTISAVQEAVFLADGNVIQDDWDLGHLIVFFDGKPKYRFGPSADRNWFDFDCDGSVVVTKFRGLNKKFIKLYDNNNYGVYRCLQ